MVAQKAGLRELPENFSITYQNYRNIITKRMAYLHTYYFLVI